MTDDTRLKRLKFRAHHRGFKEADLLMGAFADQHLAQLDPAQVDRFEALLEAPDQDVYDWITGRAAPPPDFDTDVLALLKSFKFFARSLWSS